MRMDYLPISKRGLSFLVRYCRENSVKVSEIEYMHNLRLYRLSEKLKALVRERRY